jgi:hypothetical protein
VLKLNMHRRRAAGTHSIQPGGLGVKCAHFSSSGGASDMMRERGREGCGLCSKKARGLPHSTSRGLLISCLMPHALRHTRHTNTTACRPEADMAESPWPLGQISAGRPERLFLANQPLARPQAEKFTK